MDYAHLPGYPVLTVHKSLNLPTSLASALSLNPLAYLPTHVFSSTTRCITLLSISWVHLVYDMCSCIFFTPKKKQKNKNGLVVLI